MGHVPESCKGLYQLKISLSRSNSAVVSIKVGCLGGKSLESRPKLQPTVVLPKLRNLGLCYPPSHWV